MEISFERRKWPTAIGIIIINFSCEFSRDLQVNGLGDFCFLLRFPGLPRSDYYVATRNGTFVANCYVYVANLHIWWPGDYSPPPPSPRCVSCIDFTRWIIDKRNINSCLYLFIRRASDRRRGGDPLLLLCWRGSVQLQLLWLSISWWPNENVKRLTAVCCVIIQEEGREVTGTENSRVFRLLLALKWPFR